jgi:hypothetical protein
MNIVNKINDVKLEKKTISLFDETPKVEIIYEKLAGKSSTGFAGSVGGIVGGVGGLVGTTTNLVTGAIKGGLNLVNWVIKLIQTTYNAIEASIKSYKTKTMDPSGNIDDVKLKAIWENKSRGGSGWKLFFFGARGDFQTGQNANVKTIVPRYDQVIVLNRTAKEIGKTIDDKIDAYKESENKETYSVGALTIIDKDMDIFEDIDKARASTIMKDYVLYKQVVTSLFITADALVIISKYFYDAMTDFKKWITEEIDRQIKEFNNKVKSERTSQKQESIEYDETSEVVSLFVEDIMIETSKVPVKVITAKGKLSTIDVNKAAYDKLLKGGVLGLNKYHLSEEDKEKRTPFETLQNNTKPEETKPEEKKAEEKKAEEKKADETKPDENKSEETKPAEEPKHEGRNKVPVDLIDSKGNSAGVFYVTKDEYDKLLNAHNFEEGELKSLQLTKEDRAKRTSFETLQKNDTANINKEREALQKIPKSEEVIKQLAEQGDLIAKYAKTVKSFLDRLVGFDAKITKDDEDNVKYILTKLEASKTASAKTPSQPKPQ